MKGATPCSGSSISKIASPFLEEKVMARKAVLKPQSSEDLGLEPGCVLGATGSSKALS